MKWLLTRVLAGLAAVAVVLAGAGALLAYQYSGDPAPWAASQGADAAWVGSWEDTGPLAAVLDTGGVDTVYVHAGDIDDEGAVDRVADTDRLLTWLADEYPNVRPLAWLRHVRTGSSLVEDRFEAPARETLASEAAEVAADGFAGVHLEVRPVTVNDPSMPELVSMVRGELGEEPVLSVQAQHVELLPGGRMPSFVVQREEKYWSKGYLDRVTEEADEVVLPGVDAGMPTGALYGGFMVRQVNEAVTALSTREEVTVRFGVPTYDGGEWGGDEEHESPETALAGVRLGMTGAEPPESMTLGVAFYLADEADADDLAAYRSGWLLT
ncbi:hypothetical protein DFP74_5889 [Nocardiopsis sp. Huas11]|uniref:hypothetical protein n=1 Tax=Nocardiopsis sp. Huas11 TaxID=2183912 RepID=UPI000EB2F1B5|nr:hypothetical protein [Nocardiopsis sp. Huas11]RKS10135.1 hypothetical protein DFP74_5889 [Nocardiopsis sp. Huas11]